MGIAPDINDVYPLTWVPHLVWMIQDIQKVASLDMEYCLFERNSSLGNECLILLRAPREVPHACIIAQCVPFGSIMQSLSSNFASRHHLTINLNLQRTGIPTRGIQQLEP